MKKYMTVVFEITDVAKFKAETPDFTAKMLEEDGESWRVTAISVDDEMTRIELLEQASEMDDGLEIMSAIFSAHDIHSKTMSDFVDC